MFYLLLYFLPYPFVFYGSLKFTKNKWGNIWTTDVIISVMLTIFSYIGLILLLLDVFSCKFEFIGNYFNKLIK